MLQKPVFDFFQSKMLLIEHLRGTMQIQLIASGCIPWQFQEPFKIMANNAVFRERGGHGAQSFKFPLGNIPGFLGKGCAVHGLLKQPNIFDRGFFFSKLSLDDPELLLQVEIPLTFGNGGRGFFLYFGSNGLQLQFVL